MLHVLGIKKKTWETLIRQVKHIYSLQEVFNMLHHSSSK